MKTYKVTLEYDGTNYAGWQYQPHQQSVQEVIEKAINQITQTPVSIVGAGRTDAGVHALGQVFSFRTEKSLSGDEWIRAFNGLLPADIAVQQAEEMPNDFHARYSAIGKIYEYRIIQTRYRSALERNYQWHIPRELDAYAMKEAGNFFLGTHDFSSFQNSRTDTKNPVCTVESFRVVQEHSLLRIYVQADRFLKQMVRSMVGTIVEVGSGKRQPADIKSILAAVDRRAAGRTAPPHGLYLLKVLYEEKWQFETN